MDPLRGTCPGHCCLRQLPQARVGGHQGEDGALGQNTESLAEQWGIQGKVSTTGPQGSWATFPHQDCPRPPRTQPPANVRPHITFLMAAGFSVAGSKSSLAYAVRERLTLPSAIPGDRPDCSQQKRYRCTLREAAGPEPSF